LHYYVGLTEGEKEEKARAKEALHSDGEGSDDEGDTRKAATYGTKKNEVRTMSACLSWQMHGLSLQLGKAANNVHHTYFGSPCQERPEAPFVSEW